MYLIELILGWLIGKRNGGEYFIMEDRDGLQTTKGQ